MYGGTEGLAFTLQSIRALRKQDVDLALPSHRGPIGAVQRDLDRLERRILDAVDLGRGLKVGGWDSPAEAPFLQRFELHPISRHLLWGGVWTCSNFYVVVSDSGKALFIDYGHAFLAHCHVFADHEGLESMRFVEHRLDDLERFGVTGIDLAIPTHIHDDHTCGIPYLQRHHGVRCWAPGWQAPDGYESITVDAGARATVPLRARAPDLADDRRRLMTAELLIDGASQGPRCEALVVVADGTGPRTVDVTGRRSKGRP
jgi:glyoxylase-like metal-dependent hydrolase (beta-lactamase superfamily II)